MLRRTAKIKTDTIKLNPHLHDHLGNTRITFSADAPENVVIHYAADYFPYGKILRSYAPCTFSTPRYQTTHHERDQATGYDNRGARLYDAEIARFLGVDPLADQFPEWSPYNYVYNNPLSYTDPDGRSGEPVFDEENKTVTIHSNIIIYGDAASDELAAKIASDIQSLWNGANATMGEYQIKFAITGSYNADLSAEDVEGNTDIRNNYFQIVDGDGDVGVSYVDGIGSNTGQFLLKNVSGENSTTAAHEYGHTLGIVPDARGGHSAPDQRGQGVPDIMSARGTLVDPEYQYNPKAAAGRPGGTVNPTTRRVTSDNVRQVMTEVRFNRSGSSLWRAGKLSSKFHR